MSFGGADIDLVIELWIVNVKLVWVDAYYGAFTPISAQDASFHKEILVSLQKAKIGLPYCLCSSAIFHVYRPRLITS